VDWSPKCRWWEIKDKNNINSINRTCLKQAGYAWSISRPQAVGLSVRRLFNQHSARLQRPIMRIEPQALERLRRSGIAAHPPRRWEDESSMSTIEQLDEVFSALAEEYSFRKRMSESAVQEWCWYTWSWFSLRPLDFERHGWARGRRLREAPANRHGSVCCGLDKDGRVVVEREYDELDAFMETFYNWNCTPVEAAHYDKWKKPINLLTAMICDGRTESSEMVAIHGSTREEYRWKDGLVREVAVEHAQRLNGRLLPLTPLHIAKVQYDDRGNVQRVELHWPPNPPKQEQEVVELMYERRGKRIYRKRT
jgi:hypothetical protein